MGKRSRRRERAGADPRAPAGPSSFADLGLDSDLDTAAETAAADLTVRLPLRENLGILTLRTVMSPGTRTEYAAVRRGDRSSSAAVGEDAWHRAVEFLFERLVVGWEVAGVPTTGQAPLLRRLRAATQDERAAIRQSLRDHLTTHLPDLDAP